MYKNAKFERKPSGTILIDNVESAHTKQCCHCQKHFVSLKGSGTLRGFCRNCMAVTCGSPECNVCIPFKQKLTEYENGKRLIL